MKDEVPFPELEPKNIVLFKENITKAEIAEKAEATINAVNEGSVSAIEVYTQVRAVKEVTDTILKGIKNAVMDETDALHSDERTFRGVQLQVTNGRAKYEFDHDASWNDMMEEMAQLKDKIKEREKLMINAIDYGGVADANGEEIEPAKVVGGTERSVKVIIPR